MARTTIKHVEKLMPVLNEALGRPVDAWTDGKSNIGNMHLYGANGGYSLHVIMNESGGVHCLVPGLTAREMDLYVRGMLQGAREARANP